VDLQEIPEIQATVDLLEILEIQAMKDLQDEQEEQEALEILEARVKLVAQEILVLAEALEAREVSEI
jgi:hypothetical protein